MFARSDFPPFSSPIFKECNDLFSHRCHGIHLLSHMRQIFLSCIDSKHHLWESSNNLPNMSPLPINLSFFSRAYFQGFLILFMIFMAMLASSSYMLAHRHSNPFWCCGFFVTRPSFSLLYIPSYIYSFSRSKYLKYGGKNVN